MDTKRAKPTLHIHVKYPEIESMLSQNEVQQKLSSFFALLFEIDQENTIAKELPNVQQTKFDNS